MQANLSLAKVDVLEGLTPEEVEHLVLLSTSVYLGAGETCMVGSNREALTRAFGRLRKSGAVEVRDRHIYVTDADILERMAEPRR
jgi:CRP-like cAMP-binding protein